MESINPPMDLPSPTGSSMPYVYGDPSEQYSLDSNTSESQSPISPYDMSYIPDFSGADVYPSPEREVESPDTQSSTPAAKAPAKRKRENRYKNAPPSVLSRRRAQNRASQRAYRERKDQRIKDLEQMLNEAKQRNDTLSQAYAELHAEYVKLKSAQFQDASAYHADLAFDPTIGLANNDRLDMDLFVYPDMGTYTL